MAWMALLLGLLTYGLGQALGLCILGGTYKQGLRGSYLHNKPCLSPVGFRGGFSDCGPGAIRVSVFRRDDQPHLWP